MTDYSPTEFLKAYLVTKNKKFITLALVAQEEEDEEKELINYNAGVRFNLDAISNERCKTLFRFDKDGIYRLLRALKIPDEIITCERSKFTGIEG
jgi:hypothetical protein